MNPFNSKRTAIRSALFAGTVFVSISEISLAYSPHGLLPNIKKGSVVNQAVGHEDLQQDNSHVGLIDDDLNKKNSRRGFMKTGVAGFLPLAMTTVTTIATTTDANAFENRKDEKNANVVPTPGTQPVDLGYSKRSNYVGLKQCGNSPNYWNSSTPKANILARWLPAWEANGRTIEDVKSIIDTYEVGQNNIDGGGYKIIEYEYNSKKSESSNQYIYVQFQSYKAGYIDDFECWFNPESKKFDVRSASRAGYSDLGVNAIRLEYIAKRLEKEHGWTFDRRKNGNLV